MTVAGPSVPVQNNTNPQAVLGGPAIPIHVLTSGALEAGGAIQVYEVSAAELAERGLSGGDPLRASLAPGRLTIGGPAIPVYVVAGSLGGGAVPTPPPVSPWYLTGTVLTGDVFGAWRGKGNDDYATSLQNQNNPGTNDLTEIAGAVPWTALAGWLCDPPDYFDTGFTESGVFDSTHIVRFRRLHHNGNSVWYADDVFGRILVNKSGAEQLEIYHQSAFNNILWNTGLNLLDPANDFVMAISADDIYGNGAFVGSLAGYAIGAGATTVALGGAGPTGGGTGVDIYAAVIYNRKLTLTEVQTITTQMQAL